MDIHAVIGRLPRPKGGFTLPNHKYTGPYNPLDKQLDENDIPRPGQEPYNAVDAISMRHDICYRDHEKDEGGKHKCDDKMLKELDEMKPSGFREKIDRRITRTLIGTKRRLGWGVSSPLWNNELAKELHKPIKRKFKKRRVYVKGANKIWAADLVDMQSFSRKNKGYKYILMVIDLFSRYGWAVPLKTKTASAVTKAFSDLWKDQKPPQRLWTDKGKEFYNSSMKNLMDSHNVQIYSTENEEKSSVVERWNRTIKRIMWKYFTANNTNVYIDVLADIIHKYNNTYHRSIKCTPTAARQPSNHQRVYNVLYGDEYKTASEKAAAVKHSKFKIGDRVRIVKKKGTFEKGFTPNWTEEIFTITTIKPTLPVTYTIADTKGETIQGSFYAEELQKTKQEIYRIERVLKKRKRNGGVQEVYVKWKGYDSSFNSWIPLTDLQ